jgi:hypothetical protein
MTADDLLALTNTNDKPELKSELLNEFDELVNNYLGKLSFEEIQQTISGYFSEEMVDFEELPLL